MRSFILGFVVTVGVGSVIIACGGSTEIHSLGSLPAAGGATDAGPTLTASSGGAAGNDTSTSTSSGGGGSAGTPGLPDCSEAPEDRCRLVAGHDIRALAADQTHLYWLEYGTEDDLGNPRYDGKLMAQAFEGGAPELVSGDLASPVGVALSESYFYVHLERWQDPHGAEKKALVRLPRGGGAAELVQAGLSPNDVDGVKCTYPCFGATRDFGYFFHRGGIHRLSEQAGASPTQIAWEVRWQGLVVSSPDNTVYFNTQPGGLKQLLFEADEPETLLATPVDGMQWADRLYWLETFDTGDDSSYLVGWQPGEGPSQRVAELESDRGTGAGWLKVASGHYFALLYSTPDDTSAIVSGSLADPVEVVTRVEFDYTLDPGRYLTERWVGTREAIYWIEEGAILRSP